MPVSSVITGKNLPPTCSIKGLVAFGPGIHKGELYTPARCLQITRNFERLKGKTIPLAKIGHDKQQRFAKSLGFINVGTVTRCEPIGDTGCFEVDIDDVPTEVGGEVNAGRLCGSSVELKSQEPDPGNPAQKIPGDVLTGISLLGEEQPAVRNWPADLQKRAKPHATFADGSPVPPSASPARWLNAMADVTRQMAAEYQGEYRADRRAVRINGHEYSELTVCFSDFQPDKPEQPNKPEQSNQPDLINQPDAGIAAMTPDQKAALKAAGFTDEQIVKMEASLTTTAAAATPAPVPPPTNPTMSAEPKPGEKMDFAAMCKKYAEDEKATPEQKMMAAMFSEMEENKKRVGELQASADAAQKKDEEAKMAAFSAEVAAECAKIAKKVEPKVIESVVKPTALGILTSKTFSSETDRRKTFSDYFAGFAAMPDDPRLASTKPASTNPTPAGKRPLTEAEKASLAKTPIGRQLVAEYAAAK